MINDLDKTLETLLKQELKHLENLVISFETPAAEFNPGKPALDLFLYDIRENRDLRSNEWQVERSAGMVTKLAPPVRVDCSYMITAWAGSDDKAILEEHKLLGQVMKALLRYPNLPAELLQGELAQGGSEAQDLPLPTTALLPGRLQSLAEFWQAIGNKPKAALNYTVTICVQPQTPIQLGPPVTEVLIHFGSPSQE